MFYKWKTHNQATRNGFQETFDLKTAQQFKIPMSIWKLYLS